MTLIKHELKKGYKSLAIWTLTIGFFVVICVLMFPEMKGEMEDVSEISSLARKIVNENISVHELENISKNAEVKKRVPITRREVNSDYSHVENEMREILGTKVKIDNKKVSIFFENTNDLNRILEIMNIEIK